MSNSVVLTFVQKVNGDAELQRKVAALNGNVDSLITLAGELGYTFAAQDWQSFVSSELSETDLDNVAGGVGSIGIRMVPQGGSQLGDTATHEVGHWMGFMS